MANWKKNLKIRIPALVLVLATVLFWRSYDRYCPDGPELFKNPSLSQSVYRSGHVEQKESLFILERSPGEKAARVDFPVPDAQKYPLLRVQAQARTEGVELGSYPWYCARLLLAQFDKKNKWIPKTPHQLFGIEGTTPWTTYQDEFEVRPQTDHLKLILQQAGKKGEVEYRNIHVIPVKIKSSFPWMRILFAVAWAILGFFYIPRCRIRGRKLNLLITINIIAILFGVLMPGEWISDSATWAGKRWVQYEALQEAKQTKTIPTQKTTTTPTEKPSATSQKKSSLEKKKKRQEKEAELSCQVTKDAHTAGHFGLFSSLAFLLYLSTFLEHRKIRYYFFISLDIFLFSIVTESLQFLTISRSPGIYDIRLDLSGMLLAAGIFILLLPLLLLPKFPFLNRKKSS